MELHEGAFALLFSKARSEGTDGLNGRAGDDSAPLDSPCEAQHDGGEQGRCIHGGRNARRSSFPLGGAYFPLPFLPLRAFADSIAGLQVASGSLLVTVDAHYRAVSALEFTSDGAALVSGSEDATVSVWSIGRFVSLSIYSATSSVSDRSIVQPPQLHPDEPSDGFCDPLGPHPPHHRPLRRRWCFPEVPDHDCFAGLDGQGACRLLAPPSSMTVN